MSRRTVAGRTSRKYSVDVYTHMETDGSVRFCAYLTYSTERRCTHDVTADSGPHAKAAAIAEHKRDCLSRGVWVCTHPKGHSALRPVDERDGTKSVWVENAAPCTCPPSFVPPSKAVERRAEEPRR
jgi:hypothetical protein